MIEAEIWYYVNSESRLIRFSRKGSFSAVPFIGATINVPNNSLTVTEVIFFDGGGIRIVCLPAEDEIMWQDSKLDIEIEEMTDSGWKVSSNKKRRNI